MKQYRAVRVSRSFSRIIDADAEKIFPLLCPVREYDWIEGWSCEMVYSDSGFAENNCVFQKDLPGAGKSVWVVSGYERNHAISFIVTCAGSHVERIDIEIEKQGEVCLVQWTRTFTALSEKGSEYINKFAGPRLDERMEWLFDSLEHYCLAGKPLLGRAPR